ncbi:MAG: hypothetical protein HY951_01530 [Bacteroidia bacterium]|nr:hypothetical protein [Bacteroidia bacterium]
MRNFILFIIASVLIFGCGKKEEKGNEIFSTSNNLDANNLWLNTNTIFKGNAHSGLYSSKLDTAAEYGIGINPILKNISDKLPKKITIKCWVYSTVPNLDASIVCNPLLNSQVVDWKNYDFKTIVTKANEWTEITASFDLPKNITLDTELRAFVWNPNKLTFFVDDFEFSIE